MTQRHVEMFPKSQEVFIVLISKGINPFLSFCHFGEKYWECPYFEISDDFPVSSDKILIKSVLFF